MKYSIKFEEGSLNDFFDGISYYEKASESLADRFHNEFWKTIDRIKENPHHYQKRYRDVMIAFTEIFPFGIHYVIDNDVITVIKILHTKRFFK
jgi:plasmid stabilization system protein ParE